MRSKISHLLWGHFTTTSAHEIGILYFLLALINLALAGYMAEYMRLDLAATPPGAQVQQPFSDLYYTWALSLHGLAMLLLFATQAILAIGNLMVPKLIGAPDLYWPRINALSFWMSVSASVMFWSSLLFWRQGPGPAWTLYPPLSVKSYSMGVDLILLGIVVGGVATTLGGINFILTITRLRRPDIPMLEMSLLAWSVLASSLLMVAALPPLAVGAIMLLLERHLGIGFFTPPNGDPRLFENIFWFFGHPEVYILVLPAMGVVSELVQRMSRRRAFGYTSIAISSVAIASISFAVWLHHMFASVQYFVPRIAFAVATMAVAIPSGVKVFNWIATLYGSRIRLKAPMLFALTFIFFFIIGGVTGVFFPVVPLDLYLNNTYFVVGHFHFVVNAIMLAALGGFLYYFPHITGRWYHEGLARLSWGLLSVGGFFTYSLMLASGILGMPRRYAAVPEPFLYPYQFAMTLFSFLIAAGVALYVINLLWSYLYGRPVEDRRDPWGTAQAGLPDIVEPLVHHREIPNPWPAVFGLSTLLTPIALFNIVAPVSPILKADGFVGNPELGLGALFAFLLIGALWFRFDFVKYAMIVRNLNGAARIEVPKPPSAWGDLRASVAWVIFSEFTIFATLISSAFYARVILYNQWTNALNNTPSLLSALSLAMSAALWSSSFTAMRARASFMRGDGRGFYLWAGATMALGLFFALSQFLVEYPHFFEAGFAPTSNIVAQYFFTIVTLHGLHVVMGLVFWLLVLALVRLGYWTSKRPDGVEAVEYYWHFVDAIWVVLFTLFYLGALNLVPPPSPSGA